jgi:hypothetical protein
LIRRTRFESASASFARFSSSGFVKSMEMMAGDAHVEHFG